MSDIVGQPGARTGGVVQGPWTPPLGKGPGGPDNTDMQGRIAKLEAAVEHIQSDVGEIKTELRSIRADMRSDFRLLISGIAGSFILLAGMMATGFIYGVKAMAEILQRLPPLH